MSRKRDDINQEPHFEKEQFEVDPSEERAREKLAEEDRDMTPEERTARHSIFDEPATLPNRPAVVIKQNWSCRKCGYNLRGLLTSQTCPECGASPRYEPARDGEVSLTSFMAADGGKLTGPSRAAITTLVILSSIPIAVVLTCLGVEFTGFMTFVIIGPILSEILRIAPTFVAVERYAFRLKSDRDVMVFVIVTSIICAMTQNLLFVTVFFKGYPADFYLYRWTVGVAAHLFCGMISARGLQSVWRAAASGQWPPRMRNARTMALVAGTVHASWNVIVFLTGKLGYGF